MQTRLYRAYESDSIGLNEAAITAAADLIRRGELVAFPTETVYGLGANALDEAAAARIFTAKGRPATDPLIAHIHSTTQLPQVAAAIPDRAHHLIEAFWPGPLTLILPKAAGVPANVTAGLPTVAVRLPNHPVALALLRAAGVPIVAPSANIFAHTSPTTAHHVLHDLGGRIAAVLDGGPTPVGVESTVVDVTGSMPRLLRPGGVALEALHAVVGAVEVVEAQLAEGAAATGPGMLSKHYAPDVPLILFEGDAKAIHTAIRRESAARGGAYIGMLLAEEDTDALADIPADVIVLGRLTDLDRVAARLYAALRTLERQGVDVILARSFPPEGAGLAVRDRLRRAANGKVHYL